MKKPHKSPPGKPDTMTVEEAAKRLGIGRNQGYQAARAGQIPCIRLGKRFLILRAPFELLLQGKAT